MTPNAPTLAGLLSNRTRARIDVAHAASGWTAHDSCLDRSAGVRKPSLSKTRVRDNGARPVLLVSCAGFGVAGFGGRV